MTYRLRIRKMESILVDLQELIAWASLETETGGHQERQTLENLIAARIGVRRVLDHETE